MPGQTQSASVGSEERTVRISLDIADLSAEAAYCVPVPCVGYYRQLRSVIDGAVATADVTITPTTDAGTIVGGVLTIATASSAAGDVDSAVPESCPRLVHGNYLKFTVTGGGAGGSPRGHLIIEIERD